MCQICPRRAAQRPRLQPAPHPSSHQPHVGLKVEDRGLRDLPEHCEQHGLEEQPHRVRLGRCLQVQREVGAATARHERMVRQGGGRGEGWVGAKAPSKTLSRAVRGCGALRQRVNVGGRDEGGEKEECEGAVRDDRSERGRQAQPQQRRSGTEEHPATTW